MILIVRLCKKKPTIPECAGNDGFCLCEKYLFLETFFLDFQCVLSA